MSYTPLYKKTPRSMASVKLEYMKRMNEQTVNLYPVQEEYVPTIPERIQHKEKIKNAEIDCSFSFREATMKTFLSNAIYYGLLEDVMSDQLFNSHQQVIAANMVRKFVNENDHYDLLSKWKHQSIYLAEMALLVEDACEKACCKAKNKIKEGLSEKDAYEIEDKDVTNFIVNVKDRIPKDITRIISDRVQNSVDDFIETNRKNKFELTKIYNNTKQKIEDLKAAQQQDQFAAPSPDNPMPGTPEQYQEMQEEAIRIGKGQERALLEEKTNNNVFGYMVNMFLESVHTIDLLKEAYSNNYNNIKHDKIIKDVQAIYTFMETMNMFNITPVDHKYLKKEFESIREEINNFNNSKSINEVDLGSDTKSTQDQKNNIQNNSSKDTEPVTGNPKDKPLDND